MILLKFSPNIWGLWSPNRSLSSKSIFFNVHFVLKFCALNAMHINHSLSPLPLSVSYQFFSPYLQQRTDTKVNLIQTTNVLQGRHLVITACKFLHKFIIFLDFNIWVLYVHHFHPSLSLFQFLFCPPYSLFHSWLLI